MNTLQQLAEQTLAQMGDVFHYPDEHSDEVACPNCDEMYHGANWIHWHKKPSEQRTCPACGTWIGLPSERQHAGLVEDLVAAFETLVRRTVCPFCSALMIPTQPAFKQDPRAFLCECGAVASLYLHPPISTESAKPEPARRKPGPKPDLSLAGRILAHIIEHKCANDGLSPSYRGIRRALNLGSTNMVLRNIVALEDQGLITRHESGIIVNGGRWAHISNERQASPGLQQVRDRGLIPKHSPGSADERRETYPELAVVLEAQYQQEIVGVDMSKIEHINDKLGLVTPDTQ